MPYAAQTARAVYLCGLDKAEVHAGQRRDVYYRAVTGRLPHARPDVHVPEERGYAHVVYLLCADELCNAVDKAGAQREEVAHYADQNDGRYEVGRVGYHLNRLAVLAGGALVDRQRQQYREREGREQAVQTQHQRVFEQHPEVGSSKEVFKVLQTDPRAAPYALLYSIVLKRYRSAAHGDVSKYDDICHRQEQH